MSELSVPGPRNVAGVSASGLLVSCSALLISSSVSNSHLLFSYLIKVVAFLGPLFVTTFLVLLVLLTLSPGFSRGETSGTRVGCVMGVCSIVLNKFRSNADEGTQQQLDAFEGSEVYRIVFEVPDLESGQHGIGIKESEMPPVDKFPIYDDQGVCPSEATSPHETDGNWLDEEIAWSDIESGKKSGALFQGKPCCETEYLDGKELEVKVKVEDKDFKKVVDEEKHDFHNSKRDSLRMKASEAKINDGGDDNDNVFIRRRFGDREIISGNHGGFGSMRKGKEWNRTLACKLMEERHGVEGEKMDSLWETYDEEESFSSPAWNKDAEQKPKKKKEEEGEGMMEEEGLLCCLQALRLSAGKMGVLGGVGRKPPANLVKISKALRGNSWWHHHRHHVPSHSNTNNNLEHAKKCRN